MNASTAYGSQLIADDLRRLVADLDAGDLDLDGRVAALRHDLGLAVPSALGLTVTVRSEVSLPIRISLVDEPFRPETVAATLRLPTDRLASPRADSSITYYAAVAGAFEQLAADLVYALDLPPGLAVLDERPHRCVTGSGITGLVAHSAVNRAIGVMIAKGMSPEAARSSWRRDGGLTAEQLAEAVDVVAAASTRWPHDL